MSSISKNALLPYTPAEMYALVMDIEAYPAFLPWCRSAQILSRADDELSATVELARGAIHKSFTTRNRMQRNKMIEMRLVEGPFRHLQGFWRFDPLGDNGCKVSMDMEFEFSNRLLALSLGPVFHQVVNTLVDAFSRRAVEIYGER
jgi:ribosome-associated toxin RatA of RatAB toxin-antitoxin module